MGDNRTTSSEIGVNVRGSYAQLEKTHINHFEQILGKSGVVEGPDNLKGYNADWTKSLQGKSKLVLKPERTEELCRILEFCNENNLAVCPQGGNTGVTGGSIPIFDEIILSTSSLNRIISFNKISGVLECEAGCTLLQLNDHLETCGFEMPLDLGSKSHCQIGGNLSTNAGGLRVIKFGNLHGNVLGLEAVLADGSVMDCMSLMKKDNAGYDLKQLFIGSEGTLGIITKVAVQCRVKSKSTHVAILGIESYQKVLATFQKAKEDLGEILSAVEYMDAETVLCARENLGVKFPLGDEHPYYILLETAGSNLTHDKEKVDLFLEQLRKAKLIQDGILASDSTETKEIWTVRERLAEAFSKDGFMHVFDFSLPIEYFEELVSETRKLAAGEVKRVAGFGHLGDGNIHLHVTLGERKAPLADKLEPFLYSWVKTRKGSITAEHGVGSIKRQSLGYSRPPQVIQMMSKLKNLFDPKAILNPYKVLPTKC